MPSDVDQLKEALLARFADALEPALPGIKNSSADLRAKAKLVNAQVASVRAALAPTLTGGSISSQDQLIILEYCTAIANLEYRNRVWPYEYMALSRRMGELWERFCKTAWEKPLRPRVKRVAPPSFGTVLDEIHSRLAPAVPKELAHDLENLICLIAEINMVEDEVFTVDDRLHVIDFKSGFGSNEKGNMLRLLAVGRAYQLYDPEVRLIFLVRQQENNNYLKKIKSSGLWEVHTGAEAYKIVDEVTGSNIAALRSDIIDFDNDLSAHFWNTLTTAKNEVEKYFRW